MLRGSGRRWVGRRPFHTPHEPRSRSDTTDDRISLVPGVRRFHHRALPPHSALLSGRVTPDDLAFQSESLQVWFNNNASDAWKDPGPHLHTDSDEMFVVLEGALHVGVEGEVVRVAPGEFCCFPAGVLHEIVRVEAPYRTLMIRAPSVDDKIYPHAGAADDGRNIADPS